MAPNLPVHPRFAAMRQDQMMRNGSLTMWLNGACYVSIAIALALVFMLGLWGSWLDFDRLQSLMHQSAIDRLRSHAVRTVGHLENQLEQTSNPGTPIERLDLTWLRWHWLHMRKTEDQRTFSAVCSPDGRIVAHSDATLEGKSWPGDLESASGPLLLEAKAAPESSGRRSYVVKLPVLVNGVEIAQYRTAVDADLMDAEMRNAASQFWRRWIWVMSCVTVVVLLAALSLMQLSRHSGNLQRVLDRERLRQAKELNHLVATLAHEIRNPLNAICINLHAIRRITSASGDGELGQIVDESALEAQRVDALMNQLLGYTREDEDAAECIDLAAEVRGTVAFLQESMDRANIHVSLALPAEPLMVRMSRRKMRQVLHNLLQNASDAIDADGEITIQFERRNQWATLVIEDSGPGVAIADCDRIFQPYYSTKPQGIGLGLATVRKFVRQAGGTIRCEPKVAVGASFRLVLPIADGPTAREAT